MLIKISLGEGQDFNAITEHWLVFDKVDDIDSNFIVLLCVVDLEVKPLVVAFCIDIILHDQIVGLDLQSLFPVSVQ